jgi:hypothetical protein
MAMLDVGCWQVQEEAELADETGSFQLSCSKRDL